MVSQNSKELELKVQLQQESLLTLESSANQIERLQRRCIVELEQVQKFHQWLEGKRLSRSACRVVGESRTGKTVACQLYYRQKHPPVQVSGEPPKVPVVYILPPQDCGPKELFVSILEYLKYQISWGTVAEVRAWTYRVLQACQVEMLLIDEAQRLRPKTFSEVRDILDKREIAVVLVGTERLDAVIRRDEQVHNRFKACHRFPRLSATQLVTTTQIWEQHVLKLPQASHLEAAPMQRILGQVTQGYIGLLDNILRETAIRALQKGRDHIDPLTLEEVAQEYR